jgi:hypothetical protein
MFSSASGSMNFHARFNNWSRRSRGSVPRNQIKRRISTASLLKNQT